MTTSSRQHRLFFALWPDMRTRNGLVHLQSMLKGTPTRPDRLHLTLAFLGQQPASAIPDLMRVLHALAARPMALDLDCLGHFHGQRIAWAGMRTPAPALEELHRELTAALLDGQWITRYEHERFVPHITLMRKAGAPAVEHIAPLRWQARQLVLAESAEHQYKIIASRRLHEDALGETAIAGGRPAPRGEARS